MDHRTHKRTALGIIIAMHEGLRARCGVNCGYLAEHKLCDNVQEIETWTISRLYQLHEKEPPSGGGTFIPDPPPDFNNQ